MQPQVHIWGLSLKLIPSVAFIQFYWVAKYLFLEILEINDKYKLYNELHSHRPTPASHAQSTGQGNTD